MSEQDRSTPQSYLLALCQSYLREGDRLVFHRDDSDLAIHREAGELDETRRNDLYYALKYKLSSGDTIRLSMKGGELLLEELDASAAARLIDANAAAGSSATPATSVGGSSAAAQPTTPPPPPPKLTPRVAPPPPPPPQPDPPRQSQRVIVEASDKDVDVISDWYDANPQDMGSSALWSETQSATSIPSPPPVDRPKQNDRLSPKYGTSRVAAPREGASVIVEDMPASVSTPPVIHRSGGVDAADADEADVVLSQGMHNKISVFSQDTKELRTKVNFGVALASGLGCFWLLGSGLLAELWGPSLNHALVHTSFSFWLGVIVFFLIWFMDRGHQSARLKTAYLGFRSDLMEMDKRPLTAERLDAQISLSDDPAVKELENKGDMLAPSELQRRAPEAYPELFHIDLELSNISTEALSWFKWGFGFVGCMIAGRLSDIRLFQISASGFAYLLLFLGFVFLGFLLQRKLFVLPRAEAVVSSHRGFLDALPEQVGARPGELAALISNDSLLDSGLLQTHYQKQDPDFNLE